MPALALDRCRGPSLASIRPHRPPQNVRARTSESCRAARWLAAVVILVVASVGARAVAAQIAIAPVADWTTSSKAGDEKPVSSFKLPTQTNSVKDAIEAQPHRHTQQDDERRN